jgi:hypothetical protein
MKYKFRNKYNKIIPLLLFMVFSFILMNYIFFLHSHTLSDGTVIYHAHPYHKNSSDESGEKHHHTILEYVILEQFQTFYREEVSSLLICNFIFNDIYYDFLDTVYVSDTLNTFIPRAPPLILIS